MHTLRTRFAKDIVTEFLPPVRTTKKQRVIILCGGMPGHPGKKDIIEFYSKKGFWVFNPRYRGSWESDGLFLAKSPHQDVLDVIDSLPKGFTDLWSHKKYKFIPDKIYIIGTSFGGPAAIISSLDARVDKIICISSVYDWQTKRKSESIKQTAKYTEEAFGNGYRISKNGWKKLSTGNFYNPVKFLEQVDGKKMLLVHAKDDEVCPYSESKKFSSAAGAKLITLNKGGHLGSALLLTHRFYKLFQNFVKPGKVK